MDDEREADDEVDPSRSRPHKVAELVAREIVDDIVERGLEPGARPGAGGGHAAPLPHRPGIAARGVAHPRGTRPHQDQARATRRSGRRARRQPRLRPHELVLLPAVAGDARPAAGGQDRRRTGARPPGRRAADAPRRPPTLEAVVEAERHGAGDRSATSGARRPATSTPWSPACRGTRCWTCSASPSSRSRPSDCAGGHRQDIVARRGRPTAGSPMRSWREMPASRRSSRGATPRSSGPGSATPSPVP